MGSPKRRQIQLGLMNHVLLNPRIAGGGDEVRFRGRPVESTAQRELSEDRVDRRGRFFVRQFSPFLVGDLFFHSCGLA